VLAVAVIASAVFILVAVEAFRRAGDVPADPAAARRSGTGGYPLLVDLQLPSSTIPTAATDKRHLD
jgi:hypothetical protein